MAGKSRCDRRGLVDWTGHHGAGGDCERLYLSAGYGESCRHTLPVAPADEIFAIPQWDGSPREQRHSKFRLLQGGNGSWGEELGKGGQGLVQSLDWLPRES